MITFYDSRIFSTITAITRLVKKKKMFAQNMLGNKTKVNFKKNHHLNFTKIITTVITNVNAFVWYDYGTDILTKTQIINSNNFRKVVSTKYKDTRIIIMQNRILNIKTALENSNLLDKLPK